MIASLALGERVRELERQLAEALAAKEREETACARFHYQVTVLAEYISAQDHNGDGQGYLVCNFEPCIIFKRMLTELNPGSRILASLTAADKLEAACPDGDLTKINQLADAYRATRNP